MEETVYALIHGGEYPENIDEQLFFWKAENKINLSDKEIMFQLRDLPEITDENIIRNFDDLPVIEFYHWMDRIFSGWKKTKKSMNWNCNPALSRSFLMTIRWKNMQDTNM